MTKIIKTSAQKGANIQPNIRIMLNALIISPVKNKPRACHK